MWELSCILFLGDAVFSKEGEFSHFGDFNSLVRYDATAVVRVYVNAEVRLQDFIEYGFVELEDVLVPEFMESMKFYHHDAKAAEECIGHVDDAVIFGSFDVHLEEQIGGACGAVFGDPLVHGDGVFVVGAPDEFFEEMVVFFGGL